MKEICVTIKRYLPWLFLLIGIDIFSALLLWLSDAKAFQTLIGLIVLVSLILFSAIILVLHKKEKKKISLFKNFLTDPDACNEEMLLTSVSQEEREPIRLLASVLREKQLMLNGMQENLNDYEEYVEGWAHEAKTPLSLLTMILDNRSDEIPAVLQIKLDYVRSQLQEDITQMLYYARLKSSTKDYLFEAVDLRSCIKEVVEDYAPLLEEKGFVIQNKLDAETVYTDRRGIQFMVGQIISNAIKYSQDAPMLVFSLEHLEKGETLCIADNGVGVKSCDLPYIFQKGFTGDSTDSRKKATGMGLYLTKKMADDLNLYIEAVSEWNKGFAMYISFPEVDIG